MPKAWTGRLVGKMHVHEISGEDLAAELGFSKQYVSMVLHGHRNPPGAREKFEAALDAVIKRKEGDKNG